ncbi:hypothetical protein AB838_01045 [Rhodobacteraceae bacterium (ex Bugula neritina AB1)]|nr:hypothetical protein AB838_01045 [Rhodobacteraceae bacterium (ex Bugula neritina AB1)]
MIDFVLVGLNEQRRIRDQSRLYFSEDRTNSHERQNLGRLGLTICFCGNFKKFLNNLHSAPAAGGGAGRSGRGRQDSGQAGSLGDSDPRQEEKSFR